MPTISIQLDDLYRLLGRRLDKKDLVDLLTKLKCEVEEFSDTMLVYEANHDRPDLFSVEGLARAIKNLLGLPAKEPRVSECGVAAYAESVEGRPYVAFAVVKNVTLDDEALRQIIQLQEKLHATYGRNRRKASIGLYDLDRVKPPIYYKKVDPDTTRYRPLGYDRDMSLREVLKYTDKGREYGFIIEGMPKFPVIADSEGRILSLAPILNSEDAKVTTSTRNILVDSTGLDPRIVVDMATIVAFNLYERGDATELCIVKTLYENGIEVAAPRLEGVLQEISLKEVNELIGANITVEEATGLLKQFGYKVLGVRDWRIIAQAPPYRVDVLSWVDAAEDIAIAYGYDKLGEQAGELPPATRGGRENEVEHFSYFLRSIMVSMGFSEVANYMMTNTNLDVNLFGRRVEPIVVANPISERFTSIRTWLTPGLLGVIVENKNKASDFKIFEVGDVAYVREGRVVEERRIGLAISNYNATLTDGLAAVKTLVNTLGLSPRFADGGVEGLLKERTALILIDNEVIGFVGEIHPEILYKLNYDRPVVVAEINVEKLLKMLERH